ncbi:multicopper oxidase domain-containing protein [Streptosporangium saharense]|uniref:Plastocyanin-like domain-containing protein n=1 Tax=Streptosporangium saharense TaxID=1706840 RepID=A0A7W7QL00_9ACTN|nr:multicopper oxidase domain-containing protein [Streptosporangium saharense]MBB4915319.1 hypothetical protein [Streptosporangium saharense]
MSAIVFVLVTPPALLIHRLGRRAAVRWAVADGLALSANGRPVTGSPWWIDSLDMPPGTWFEIGFLAGNPGLWMDHCHNLEHAAAGMMMHLGYEGVTTRFETGSATGNRPE